MARMLHDDTDETVREMAADSLARLGFLNVNTGEITADGNYRTAKFISNKRLFYDSCRTGGDYSRVGRCCRTGSRSSRWQ